MYQYETMDEYRAAVADARARFVNSIESARADGMNYAECNGHYIQFCSVERNATPCGWSRDPEALQFWL